MLALRRSVGLAAVVAVSLFLIAGVATPASAGRDINYTMYGSRNGGWGFTSASLTVPGPAIGVWVGDNVTLNLTATDGILHRWFIDYNNNSVADGSEPRSPNFGTRVLWNFTVSNQTGTFRYRSDRTAGPGDDLANMWGNITISPAGSGGGLLDSGILVPIILVVGVVVVVAILALQGRRRRVPPLPPPPED